MIWLVALAVVCTAGSQLMQALAARRLDAKTQTDPICGSDAGSSLFRLGFTMLREPRVLAAYALLGLGLLFWLVALTELDVSAAYPLFALGSLVTLLVARFGLGEHVTLRGWCGAVFIVVGGVLCNL